MLISTKVRFAVTAMIDMALREKIGPVPLSDIAVRQQISLSYLKQIFSKLRQRGLFSSRRGLCGGYTLGRLTDSITVADTICAVENAQPNVNPLVVTETHDSAQEFWNSVNIKLLGSLKSITLNSLVLEQLAKGIKIENIPASNRRVFKKTQTKHCFLMCPTRCLR